MSHHARRHNGEKNAPSYLSGGQRQIRPTHPYAPISAVSQTAEPRKIIQEDPGEAVFQTMDAAPPVRITWPTRSVKSICTLASQQRHLGQEPV